MRLGNRVRVLVDVHEHFNHLHDHHKEQSQTGFHHYRVKIPSGCSGLALHAVGYSSL